MYLFHMSLAPVENKIGLWMQHLDYGNEYDNERKLHPCYVECILLQDEIEREHHHVQYDC